MAGNGVTHMAYWLYACIFLSSYLVSRLPYFTWLMVVVTLSAVLVQMEELRTGFDQGKTEPSYLWVADFLFVLFTLVELTLKVCTFLLVYLCVHMTQCPFPDTCQWILPQPGCSHPQPLGCDGLGVGGVFCSRTHH